MFSQQTVRKPKDRVCIFSKYALRWKVCVQKERTSYQKRSILSSGKRADHHHPAMMTSVGWLAHKTQTSFGENHFSTATVGLWEYRFSSGRPNLHFCAQRVCIHSTHPFKMSISLPLFQTPQNALITLPVVRSPWNFVEQSPNCARPWTLFRRVTENCVFPLESLLRAFPLAREVNTHHASSRNTSAHCSTLAWTYLPNKERELCYSPKLDLLVNECLW